LEPLDFFAEENKAVRTSVRAARARANSLRLVEELGARSDAERAVVCQTFPVRGATNGWEL